VEEYKGSKFFIMMKKLRGRNLAHPGCLIGLTAGLIVGITSAGILAVLFNVSLNMLMLVWLFVTFGLAAAGWIIGDRLSSRFPVLEEAKDEQTSLRK
jgi:amino acid transporter